MAVATENAGVDNAVKGLREIHAAYERLFRHPSMENLEICNEEHARVLQLLGDKAVMGCIEERIAWARDANHTTVGLALENLEHPDEGVLDFELSVGERLGYRRPKMRKLIKEAKNNLKRALSRGDVPPTPEAMKALVKALEDLNQYSNVWLKSSRKIGSGRSNTQKTPRRVRHARKSETRNRATRDLLLVGSIVANGRHRGYFHYSYAISLGLAAGGS
jgi:hypothetical protein